MEHLELNSNWSVIKEKTLTNFENSILNVLFFKHIVLIKKCYKLDQMDLLNIKKLMVETLLTVERMSEGVVKN